jgi:hypothetical protein
MAATRIELPAGILLWCQTFIAMTPARPPERVERRNRLLIMSESAIEFLQEWICEKCKAPAEPIRIDKQAETLARECAEKAAEAGIPLEDIQEEVGDIQELIASRLEDAVEEKRERKSGAG